jgi:hypothetical protein
MTGAALHRGAPRGLIDPVLAVIPPAEQGTALAEYPD